MKWSFKIATVAGTEVRIHITFFILLVFVAMQGMAGGHGLNGAVDALLFVSAAFVCVLLHEFGHVFAAAGYGIRTPDITLFPFGGVARVERIPENPRQEIVIALAGPAVNVVIVGFLWLALILTGARAWLDPVTVEGSLVRQVLMANVMLVLFNLIPAFPMDGGRVLRALLALRFEHAQATRVAASVGQALAVAIGLIGVFGFHAGKVAIGANPMLILVAFFVFMAAANEAGAVQMQAMIRGLSVSAAMVTEFKSLPRNASLGEAAEVLLHTSQHEFPVVDPDGTLRGIFTRSELVAALREAGPQAPVLGVMRENFPVIHPETPFDEAFQLMQQSATPVLPVTNSEGRIVGLFTMENIGEMLMVRSAIAQSRRG